MRRDDDRVSQFAVLLDQLGFREEKYLTYNRDLRAFRGDIVAISHHLLAHGLCEGRRIPVDKPEAVNIELEKLDLCHEIKQKFRSSIERGLAPDSELGPNSSRLRFEQIDPEAPLGKLRFMHTGEHWLVPKDLTVTDVTFRRVLFVGSCLAGCWGLHKNNPSGCEGDFVLTNNWDQLGDPPRDPASYDFQVVQIPFRSIFPDASLWRLERSNIAAHKAAFDDVCARLSRQLKSILKWNSEYGILTFVANFMVPQQNPLGRLLPRYDLSNPSYFIEKVNENLERMLKEEYKNVYLLDVDKIAACLGRAYIQDDSIAVISHNALVQYGGPVAARIEPMASVNEHFDIRWHPEQGCSTLCT
jgi:hypothetical protein